MNNLQKRQLLKDSWHKVRLVALVSNGLRAQNLSDAASRISGILREIEREIEREILEAGEASDD